MNGIIRYYTCSHIIARSLLDLPVAQRPLSLFISQLTSGFDDTNSVYGNTLILNYQLMILIIIDSKFCCYEDLWESQSFFQTLTSGALSYSSAYKPLCKITTA